MRNVKYIQSLHGKRGDKTERRYLIFIRVKAKQLGTSYEGELISLSPVQIKKPE